MFHSKDECFRFLWYLFLFYYHAQSVQKFSMKVKYKMSKVTKHCRRSLPLRCNQLIFECSPLWSCILFMLSCNIIWCDMYIVQLHGHFIQGDQLSMAVYFWYLVKIDLSRVHVYNSIHWTSHFLKGTRKIRPCLSDRVVYYVYCTGCCYVFTILSNKFCKFSFCEFFTQKKTVHSEGGGEWTVYLCI